MSTQELKDAIELLKEGDPITNSQLKELIDFFEVTTDNLKILGERFHLAWLDCFHTLERVKGYKRARVEAGLW